ncbi:hypothetical protein CYY_002668 [Polysphondylium violaceum]|uniref:HTH TFE/IIEalpha-type domain-containing protein n=1 Tax=Polysphondylium violaceum TaxID=133409 RepID=A0A8J4PVX2_9MYCE|nr:hypothetical protein CYY_002668 [Polysphondylium violaceum]
MSSTYTILDDLVKLVIRSFYPDDFAVIVDALLREKKRVRDEQLANTLRVQQKYVRKILLDLKGDSMVKSADVKIEGTKPGERTTTQLLWYIDYKHIIDIVKYKLWMFGKKMESVKVQKIDVQTYRCTVCSKIFTAYDIPKLLSPEGELFCDDCDGELIEDHNNESLTQTAKHQSDLSSQLKKIVEQLKKTEGLQIPIFARDLAEESSGAGSNLTINANSSSGFGPKQSAFAPVSQSAATKTPLNTNPNSIDFVIEILENDNIEMNKAPVKKDNKKTGMASLPPWLLPSNSILNKSKNSNNANVSQANANSQKDNLLNVKREPVVVDQEVYLDYIKNHYKEWESYDPSNDTTPSSSSTSSKRALEDENHNNSDPYKKKIKYENEDSNSTNGDYDDQQVASTSQSPKDQEQEEECDVFVSIGKKYIPLTQVTEQDQEDMTAQEYEDYSTALYKYATRNLFDYNNSSIIA